MNKGIKMSISLPYFKSISTRLFLKYLSEVLTSSNTAIFECLGQLQLLDQQIIALQSKMETSP